MAPQASAGILLVLRRMRAPLIVVIVIFAISVLGLTLVPGQDADGQPWRMNLFEAFYFMSYTATTIGFGEIPYAFSAAQRMWVTFSIFLSVIGWAYAVGSLLSLVQDKGFRRALARRHFARKVARMREPFLVLVGYGNATRRLARSLDDMGRRFVVIDREEARITAVELGSYRADTPALLGDARDTDRLEMAGLHHPFCEGVVALAGDDDTNLDVTMTTALLRPDLRVIARTSSREIAERMQTFGKPEVVNPLDRFGDHLRILLRSPSAYQLMVWLTSAPGTALPDRHAPLPRGRWVVSGTGRFAHELTDDLRKEGLEVTVVDPDEALQVEQLRGAGAFVAATESDTTNLWLVESARRAQPDVFLVTLQNRAANASLFRAVGADFGMEPAEVVAHEVLARLANPALMRFLPEVPHQGEEWAAALVQQIVDRCGAVTPDLWLVRLTDEDAPAVQAWLAEGMVVLGDLLRNPQLRDDRLDLIVLGVLRDGEMLLAPGDDLVLEAGDRMLLAGGGLARRALDLTLTHRPAVAYVVEDRVVPAGWLLRRLARQEPAPRQRTGVTK